MSQLFSPINLTSSTKLSHRIALAPLTRLRANKDHVHTYLAEEYYRQRSSVPGTLLISEATLIAPRGGGFPNVPGIWNKDQIAAWKRVTSAVHANKSSIFLQLWAMGRAANPLILEAEGIESGVVGPSAIPINDKSPTPRALSAQEIEEYISAHATAAKNAIEAGFDGVEIHAANGYLVDQFLQSNSNARTDEWGGSVERRSRFAVEITKAVAQAVGANKTGIRLSPWSAYQSMRMKDPVPQFTDLLEQLKPMGLAYLHLVEPRLDGAADVEHTVENAEDSNDFIYRLWSRTSPIVVAGGFGPETATRFIQEHTGNDIVVAFGRHFLANPDLPFRIANHLSLNPYDRESFYIPEQLEGYTDYEFSKEWKERIEGEDMQKADVKLQEVRKSELAVC